MQQLRVRRVARESSLISRLTRCRCSQPLFQDARSRPAAEGHPARDWCCARPKAQAADRVWRDAAQAHQAGWYSVAAAGRASPARPRPAVAAPAHPGLLVRRQPRLLSRGLRRSLGLGRGWRTSLGVWLVVGDGKRRRPERHVIERHCSWLREPVRRVRTADPDDVAAVRPAPVRRRPPPPAAASASSAHPLRSPLPVKPVADRQRLASAPSPDLWRRLVVDHGQLLRPLWDASYDECRLGREHCRRRSLAAPRTRVARRASPQLRRRSGFERPIGVSGAA